MTSLAELEQSIEALESRNAFQDDVIDQLNSELTIHQAQISEIKAQLQLISSRIKDAGPQQDNQLSVEPPPPHY
ncbi:MAG: SlyX protein [Alteromonadaceae bacterium]|jgi:SlyX protein